MSERTKRALPSPALVIACIALVVSLSGTAVAAGIVANARHANRADLAARALNSDKACATDGADFGQNTRMIGFPAIASSRRLTVAPSSARSTQSGAMSPITGGRRVGR